MQPPVIFIIGPCGHGKTTVREIISKLTGLPGASCSDVIYAFLAQRRGVPLSDLRALPKEEIRPALIAAGDFLCGTGVLEEVAKDATIDDAFYKIPSCLIRALFFGGIRVIDGMRRKLELSDARNHLNWCGVQQLTIWVENPKGVKIKDSTEVSRDDADEVVVNDGTPAELQEKIEAILSRRFPKKVPEPDIYIGPPKRDVQPTAPLLMTFPKRIKLAEKV